MTVLDQLNCYSKHKKQKKILQTISFIIFWDILTFYQIFLSSQVKRWVIITYKHGNYVLLHELPNNSRLRILEN